MQFDIFFSISQTPVDGHTPDESAMFRNFFQQVEAADQMGFGTAWVAEAHQSSQVQKRHRHPVVPHWEGEIGLNTDIFQLSNHIFARTKNLDVGSAVTNLLCNGGPIARAEQVAAWAALHGLDPHEKRRLRVGFSAGRFDFMNRTFGIVPRTPVEEAAWPALKGQVFREACEVFLRLLRGDVLSSEDTLPTTLSRANFRSDEDWARVQRAAGGSPDVVAFERRYTFEPVQIVPREWRRELVDLVLGSHDAPLQELVNRWMPVKVFNLSITQPHVIEDTHRRMAQAYHSSGGAWQRSYMPRTVMVFLNDEPGLTKAEQSEAARAEARKALGAYWTALEGTIDPAKVQNASDNALVGNTDEVAAQVRERFHPDDAVMLWFDFFNHDSDRVVRNMAAFMDRVAPRL